MKTLVLILSLFISNVGFTASNESLCEKVSSDSELLDEMNFMNIHYQYWQGEKRIKNMILSEGTQLGSLGKNLAYNDCFTATRIPNHSVCGNKYSHTWSVQVVDGNKVVLWDYADVPNPTIRGIYFCPSLRQ